MYEEVRNPPNADSYKMSWIYVQSL